MIGGRDLASEPHANTRILLERYLKDDTVLALQLLCLVGDQYHELAFLGTLLAQVDRLVMWHLARLEGAEIVCGSDACRIAPLPEF